MLAFDTAQFDGILKKLSEFNNSLLSDPVSYLLQNMIISLFYMVPALELFYFLLSSIPVSLYYYIRVLLVTALWLTSVWLDFFCLTLIFAFLQEKKHLSLSDSDMSRFNAIVKILKDTSHYHSSRFSDVDVALTLKVLKSWPVAVLFPGKYL